MLHEFLHTWMLETRIGENGQQTAPEVGMRNWNGAGGISVPQNAFMNISKPRLERLDPVSRIGTPRSALVLPKEMRGRGGNTHCPCAVSTAGSFHQKSDLFSNQKNVRVPQELQQGEEEEGSRAACAWPQHKLGFFKSQQLQRVYRIWETRPSNWKGIQLFKLRLGLCLYLFCL